VLACAGGVRAAPVVLRAPRRGPRRAPRRARRLLARASRRIAPDHTRPGRALEARGFGVRSERRSGRRHRRPMRRAQPCRATALSSWPIPRSEWSPSCAPTHRTIGMAASIATPARRSWSAEPSHSCAPRPPRRARAGTPAGADPRRRDPHGNGAEGARALDLRGLRLPARARARPTSPTSSRSTTWWR